MRAVSTATRWSGHALWLVLVCVSPAWAADYEVTFEGLWNAADHPTGYPPDAHFSSLIGASHNGNDSYWAPGEAASMEIERVAESGNRSPLEAVIDASPNVTDKIVASGFFSPGTTAALNFSVDANHPFVSLVSMVAPSPDWFVGVHGLDLRDGNGFVASLVVDLFAYDAGTEEGTAFSGANLPSPPGGVITPVDQSVIFGGTSPVARFTFIRTSDPFGSVFEARAADSNDDAEERSDGTMVLTSDDLELVTDGNEVQLVGVRVPGVWLRRRAFVREAWIQFQAAEVSTESTVLEIRAHDSGDAASFSGATSDLSNRPRTSASVDWVVPAWPVIGAQGAAQRTPDLAEIIQEIVDQPTWFRGGALVFVFEGSGVRTAESFDGSAVAAPQLHVRYSNAAGFCGFGPELSVVMVLLYAARRARSRGSATRPTRAHPSACTSARGILRYRGASPRGRSPTP